MPKIDAVKEFERLASIGKVQATLGKRYGRDTQQAEKLGSDAKKNEPLRFMLNQQGNYYESQLGIDSGMWYGALNSDASGVVKRIFTLLRAGGLYVYRKDGWQAFAKTKAPIATVLSHGGRVMIQLPLLQPGQPGTPSPFVSWLLGGSPSVNLRKAGTHGLSLAPGWEQIGNGRQLNIKETGGKGVGLKSFLGYGNGTHYGMNVALGGVGKRNFATGAPIAADGNHGHLYFFVLEPTAHSNGGMLIGCETSQPPDWGKSADQFGGGHSIFGGSNRFSGTGGLKFTDVKHHPPGVSEETWHACGPSRSKNGFAIDLSDGWEHVRTSEARFDPSWVGEGAAPPYPSRANRRPLGGVGPVQV